MTDEEMAVQHLQWCMDLHRRIAPDPGQPACWSPYSTACALGLVTHTARGATRKELDHLLLGESADAAQALARYASLFSSAALLDGQSRARSHPEPDPSQRPRLAVANTVWVDDRLTLAPTATEPAWTMWPGAAVRQLPFSRSPDHSRAAINRDIAETTQGLIPELLPVDAVSTDTVAVLVNALYLRTSWTTPFPPRRTAPAPFYGPAGAIAVETMRVTASMQYAHAPGWQIVDIPAAAGVSATVLLPDDSLDDAEHTLTGSRFLALIQAARPRRVDLSLPRLRQRARLSLTQVLKDSGVHTLFDQRADLTGLAQGPLAVSDVLHESVLQVDERGLEGAAATAATVARSAAVREEPIIVRIDRPFLLAVRHQVSGVVYFLARVTRPR